MKEQTKYEKMAHNLYTANFRVYGIGNFDVSENEVATILEILEKNEDINEFYGRLEKKRMG